VRELPTAPVPRAKKEEAKAVRAARVARARPSQNLRQLVYLQKMEAFLPLYLQKMQALLPLTQQMEALLPCTLKLHLQKMEALLPLQKMEALLPLTLKLDHQKMEALPRLLHLFFQRHLGMEQQKDSIDRKIIWDPTHYTKGNTEQRTCAKQTISTAGFRILLFDDLEIMFIVSDSLLLGGDCVRSACVQVVCWGFDILILAASWI
jgi:hypothetical protein